MRSMRLAGVGLLVVVGCSGDRCGPKDDPATAGSNPTRVLPAIHADAAAPPNLAPQPDRAAIERKLSGERRPSDRPAEAMEFYIRQRAPCGVPYWMPG
jgi:hypothetical protein